MLRKIIIALTATLAIAAPIAATTSPASASPRSQAIGSARDYLAFTHFSKAGLIDQLSSKYGDGYSRSVATYAVNHIKVNWNKQAVGSAKDYLAFTHFSCSGLIDQLHSPYGDKYTLAQARYGAYHTSAC